MLNQDLARMKSAHRRVAEFPFEVIPIEKGYAGRGIRIDFTTNEIRLFPVTQRMKDLWVGGKGLDLWLMFQEVTAATRWDSPENPICFSPGPLAGTTSFPGSGKTLVTSLSPMTGSVMDCNVGGYFGPLLKFCGFDALVLIGKAPEETIVTIDAPSGRITIERAPLESIDAHLLSEELTDMYAEDEYDKKNISVVSAGRGAQHTRMGVLNFSFYDWRKRCARIKQAGRGGIGRVFRDKKLKALVIRNHDVNPAWSVAESPVAACVRPGSVSEIKDAAGREAIRAAIAKWNEDPLHALDMLNDIQARFGHIPRTAIDEITRATTVPAAYLYHAASFVDGLSLEAPAEMSVQVCTGIACAALGADRIVKAFEDALGVKAGKLTADSRVRLMAGSSCGCEKAPASGPCLGACAAAPLARIGDTWYGHVRPSDVAALLDRHLPGSSGASPVRPASDAARPKSGDGRPLSARPLSAEDLSLILAESAARQARARALLTICTGRRSAAATKGNVDEAAASAKPASSGSGSAPNATTIVAGCVERPGEVAIEKDATVRAILDRAGGVRPGASLRAVQAGGPSGAYLGAEKIDAPMRSAFQTPPPGAATGPDRVIAIDDSVCPAGLLRAHAAQLLAQSCGKCTPCREGLHQISLALARLERGTGKREDLETIAEMCAAMETASACAFGVWAAQPMRTGLSVFARELEEHAAGRTCPAKRPEA